MRRDSVRNLAIVVGIALVLTFVSAAGAVAAAIGLVLRILLLAAFIWFGYVLWRENRSRLAWLPSRNRSILYAAAALLGILLIGGLVWPYWNGVSAIAFLVLVGGLAFVIWKVWTDAQRYY